MHSLFQKLLVIVVLWAMSLGMSPWEVFAQGDQFIVSQSVISADTEPPTIPQNVVATTVSLSEIDIDWDNATDNVSVSGYQVFRDGVQIATSAVSNYSDSGLTPATSYAYTVVAFDAAGNYSTSSATSTATTDPVPTAEPMSGGGAPHYAVPVLSNFTIDVNETSAKLYFETTLPVRAIVSWGETSDYEIASLQSETFLSRHSTELLNLTPGTVYKFRIVGRDHAGNTTILKTGSFMTVALPDQSAPPNVRNLRGVIEGEDAVLSWKNPEVEDFDRVRIVRKEVGYPRDPYDGALVYEGGAEEFRDSGAFREDGAHYYAVFAYDKEDNGSSGAVVRLERKGGQVVTTPVVGPLIDLGTSTPLAPLGIRDVIVEQGGKIVNFEGTSVPLRGDVPFTLKIPYDRLPEHLKTILVTFTHPSDQSLTFSFLLRVNEEKTFYTATIDALGEEGSYSLSLSVMDYLERTISHVEGSLEVIERPVGHTPQQKELGFLGYLLRMFMDVNPWILITLFLLLLTVIAFSHRKREAHAAVVYVPMK